MDRNHRQDGRDLLIRTVAPGTALFALVVGVGLALTGPLVGLSHSEESINKYLADHRTTRWNAITLVWSHIGNTGIVVGVCIAVAALVLWRTRDWRLAAVPLIAISLQLVIFLLAAHLVGRTRPPVAKLDPAPPTSSYPSGHVGATTALYVGFALLATRIRRAWLRWATIAVCLAVPLLVSFARLYRGMHHISDVAAAMLNGLTCALLAYNWYRHRKQAARRSVGVSESKLRRRRLSQPSKPSPGHKRATNPVNQRPDEESPVRGSRSEQP